MSRESALAIMGAATPETSLTAVPPAKTAIDGNVPHGTSETPKPDELQSQRLAIFAKKEAQILKDREALKKEREDWLKDKQISDEYKTKGQQFDELRKKDPIAAMKLIGMTETEIVNFINNGGENATPNTEEVARKIAQEEFNKLRDELKVKEETEIKTKNTRLVDGLKTDIKDQIKTQAEKYEYCSFEGPSAERMVYEIIVENLKESNELLTVDQALDIAEEYYETRDKAMATLKKRQPKVETTADVARGTQAKKAPVSNSGSKAPKTLTNEIAATAAGASTQGTRRETSSEKRLRLMAALSAMGKQ